MQSAGKRIILMSVQLTVISVLFSQSVDEFMNSYSGKSDWNHSKGELTLTLQNLTSLNPFGFQVRGEGNLIMISDCNFPDNRGGPGITAMALKEAMAPSSKTAISRPVMM
jgi:hypothetical protein